MRHFLCTLPALHTIGQNQSQKCTKNYESFYSKIINKLRRLTMVT